MKVSTWFLCEHEFPTLTLQCWPFVQTDPGIVRLPGQVGELVGPVLPWSTLVVVVAAAPPTEALERAP